MIVRPGCLEAHDAFSRGVVPEAGFTLLRAALDGSSPPSWRAAFFISSHIEAKDGGFALTGDASMVDIAVIRDDIPPEGILLEGDASRRPASRVAVSCHPRSRVGPVEIAYPRGLGYSYVFLDPSAMRTDLESFIFRVLAHEGGLSDHDAKRCARDAVQALLGVISG